MFSVPTLSIGDVRIAVRPATDEATLQAVVSAINGIKGIARVIVDHADRDTTVLVARADRPVSLAGEIRAALRSKVASCTMTGDQIVLELAGVAPAPGRAGRADRNVDARGPAAASLAIDGAAVEAIGDLGEFSILLFDLEQRYTSCAGGFHKRFGHQFALMQGRRASEVVGSAVWPTLQPGYDGALAGLPSTIDFEVPDRDGVFEASFRPLRDGTRIIGGMVVSREVTEQRRASRMLEETSAVLQVTFDASPIAYGLLAPDGRWVRVNRALQELVGCTEATLVAERARDRTHPSDQLIEDGLLAMVIAGHREHYALTKQVRRDDGSWIEVEVTVTAIRAHGRTLQGFVVCVGPTATDA